MTANIKSNFFYRNVCKNGIGEQGLLYPTTLKGAERALKISIYRHNGSQFQNINCQT